MFWHDTTSANSVRNVNIKIYFHWFFLSEIGRRYNNLTNSRVVCEIIISFSKKENYKKYVFYCPAEHFAASIASTTINGKRGFTPSVMSIT